MPLAHILQALHHPAAALRPVMFWMWNADPTVEQMRRQLAEIAAAGCGAVCIHPMPDSFRKRDFVDGMQTPYLSDRFFQYIAQAVEEAKRASLLVWLYDEGGWPSGHALGQVADGHPEFSGWVLRQTEEGVRVEQGGYRADLMNPAAVRRFIELTHERYAKAVGHEFGRTVTAMFTDEMRVGGSLGSDALPWTPDLPRLFQERKGYPLEPLEALFGDDEGTARLRYDYADVWSTLFREAYLDQIHDWCRQHGIASVGHFPGEDETAGPVKHGWGDAMRGLAGFDLPGVDAIWRQVFPGGPFTDFPRLAGSSGRQHGRPACTESFAVYGWGLTPAQMKWVTEHQAVRGVTIMAPMLAALRAKGSGIVNTSSHLAWGNPLWPHFRHYADYTARLAALLAVGEPAVDVAVYLPARSLWVRPHDPATETGVVGLAQALAERQVDFDYLGDDDLAAANLHDGCLVVGRMRYRALCIPACHAMPAAALERVGRATAAGVLVATVGRPAVVANEPPDRCQVPNAWRQVHEMAAAEAAADLVRERLAPTIRLAPAIPAVRCCRRTAESWDLLFLTNEAADPVETTLEQPPAGRAYTVDLGTGTTHPVAELGGRVPVRLEGYGAAMVLFDRTGEAAAAAQPLPPAGATIQAASLAWQARPLVRYAVSEAGIAQQACTEPSRPLPFDGWRQVEPHFSGTVEYTTRLQGQAGPATIDLGTVRHVAEVWLNGRPAGTRCWPPYRLPLTLQPGANRLRVVVTNTLANEFAREQVKEMMRRLGWHNVYRQRCETFEADELPGS